MKKLVYLLAILATACSPEIQTYSDYDKEFDVSQFRTYNWSKPLQADRERYPLYYNEITDQRIRSAVNDLLAIRGYVLTDSSAEFTLDYTITVEERSVFLPDPYGYMYWDYYMRSRPDVFNYREATLALDVSNASDGHLLWRGWAVGVLEVVVYESGEVEVAIRSAIAKILKDFPESAKNQSVDMTIKIH
ncbi:DUF4136 domain-containing protein [Dyadobacter bucti]|uniref:DUF4136 domain-containing protein n=1 Tax=Dyadobacter bucti TaxID=2572203 RepID=UPI003F6FCB41